MKNKWREEEKERGAGFGKWRGGVCCDFGRVLLYVISCEEIKREKCWEEILREFCYGEEGMKKCEGGKGYL